MIKLLTVIFQFATSWIGRGSRIENKLTEIDKRVLRLELLQAMQRKDTHAVCALFDVYKQMGGNSYMIELYEEYMKKQHKDKL